MREILFRGKAINRDKGWHRTKYKNGDWVYGIVTRLYDNRFENLPAEMTNINGVSGIEVDYKTIGQYTGLKDKNGTKIFEGDIIQHHFEIGVVRFGSYETPYREWSVIMQDIFSKHIGFYIDWITLDYRKDIEFWKNKIKIIGNIHDNPELLKEAQQE